MPLTSKQTILKSNHSIRPIHRFFKSVLALSRDLGVDYKTSFVLTHKLREAMAEEMKGRVVGGVGKEAGDRRWFGGYVKPANLKADRADRRLARNQNGKRQAVIIIREHGGNSVPAVFRSESAAFGLANQEGSMSFVVNAGYDQAEGRYYVLTSNVEGLHVEASSFEEVEDTATQILPELVGGSMAGSSISFRRERA